MRIEIRPLCENGKKKTKSEERLSFSYDIHTRTIRERAVKHCKRRSPPGRTGVGLF